MWGWASASQIAKDGPYFPDTQKSFSVNDEYLHAFRTESYVEFFTKAQLLVNKPSSSSSPRSSTNTMDILLEPEQHLVPPILEAFSKHLSDLKSLMLRYFDTSAQASGICSKLLTSIIETHAITGSSREPSTGSATTHQSGTVQQSQSWIPSLIKEIHSPIQTPEDFKQICDNFSSILHCLRSKRKKVARKIKLIEFIKKASGVCLTVACSVCALVAIGIAVHSISGPVIGPVFLGILPVQLKKKFSSLNCFRCTSLRKLRKQLDVAAKGTYIYILNRDFVTVSRIVARLHDEVEHSKEMISFCLERREDMFPLEEVVKEFRKNSRGFKRHVEELEEHVCLCLVNIHRARV